MAKFAVYRSYLLAIPGSMREVRLPGKPPVFHEDYRVQMEQVGHISAFNAETALQLAKLQGYICPIIGPWKGELQ